MRRLEKRSIVSPERLLRLKSKESLYVVSCVIDFCHCNRETEGCQRGFFSLFLQAITGLYFSQNHNLKCQIDFGNMKSLFSEPQKFGNDLNFWNYYFEQPFDVNGKGNEPILNEMYETYPLRIWDRSYFQKLNEVVKKYVVFKNPLADELAKKRVLFGQNKVLGIHIRKTDHSGEIEPVDTAIILGTIKKELKIYDKLFVATDDAKTLALLEREFSKDRIISNKVTRSNDDEAIHTNMKNTDRYQLGFDAILDCYCLSLCDKTILTHSNLSYSSLLFNPKQQYILLETRKSKFKRLKTLLLYHLDRLGIRKW